MKVCGALAVASALLAVSAASRAEQPATARSLAANCTGCHGPNGESAGAIPSIAGLEPAYFLAAMQEFRDGKRPATVMHQHAKGYTEQEFEVLAAYFSAQQRR